jgi:hypothetical protein
MHRSTKFLFVFLLLAVLAFTPMTATYAAQEVVPATQEADLPSLPDLFETGKNLAGIAFLFAALINVGKQVKPDWFPDGSASAWTLVTQTITTVLLVGLQLTNRADLIPVIDENAGLAATILTSFIALAYNLLVARKWHESVLAGLPGIGFSNSGRKAGEGVMVEVSDIKPDFSGFTESG